MDAIFFCKECCKPFLKGKRSIAPFSYGHRINKKDYCFWEFLRINVNFWKGLFQVEKNSWEDQASCQCGWVDMKMEWPLD